MERISSQTIERVTKKTKHSIGFYYLGLSGNAGIESLEEFIQRGINPVFLDSSAVIGLNADVFEQLASSTEAVTNDLICNYELGNSTSPSFLGEKSKKKKAFSKYVTVLESNYQISGSSSDISHDVDCSLVQDASQYGEGVLMTIDIVQASSAVNKNLNLFYPLPPEYMNMLNQKEELTALFRSKLFNKDRKEII